MVVGWLSLRGASVTESSSHAPVGRARHRVFVPILRVMESRGAAPDVARPASPPRHAVRTLLDVRIPASDGVELSANLWLPVARDDAPVDAPGERFPAILEMIPYRKDDWRAASDRGRGEWLAARGYAFCRLDVRGTGSSGGVAKDEYTARETLDGCEAVGWLADQPWSNGNVGMWGISYGGFTAIQVAKLRPPALKAIVPMMATDDRYTDDVHYLGGCVTVSELSQYAVSMVGMNALPPWPAFRGEGWVDEWRERLERTPVWLFEWLSQQHDGPYWRQGSLAPDYDAIEAAIFSIGGWMDEYVDAALRMQERCSAPRRTLVGNWVHSYPDDANPGPNLDWHHELVRFFDHWLKGADNGVMDEPAVVLFRHDEIRPEPFPRRVARGVAGVRRVAAAGDRGAGAHLAPGPLPLVGELRDDPPGVPGDRTVRPSPDDRDEGVAVVGRRLRPERPGPRSPGPTRR
jgi:predicted acyl esterase